MARPCACCTHPQRHQMEAEHIAGRSSRAIGATYGLRHDAVHRHMRGHLPTILAASRLAAIDAGTAPSPAPIVVPEIEPAEAPPENETSFTDAAPHVPRALDFGDAPTDAPAPQGSPLASIPAEMSPFLPAGGVDRAQRCP